MSDESHELLIRIRTLAEKGDLEGVRQALGEVKRETADAGGETDTLRERVHAAGMAYHGLRAAGEGSIMSIYYAARSFMVSPQFAMFGALAGAATLAFKAIRSEWEKADAIAKATQEEWGKLPAKLQAIGQVKLDALVAQIKEVQDRWEATDRAIASSRKRMDELQNAKMAAEIAGVEAGDGTPSGKAMAVAKIRHDYATADLDKETRDNNADIATAQERARIGRNRLGRASDRETEIGRAYSDIATPLVNRGLLTEEESKRGDLSQAQRRLAENKKAVEDFDAMAHRASAFDPRASDAKRAENEQRRKQNEADAVAVNAAIGASARARQATAERGAAEKEYGPVITAADATAADKLSRQKVLGEKRKEVDATYAAQEAAALAINKPTIQAPPTPGEKREGLALIDRALELARQGEDQQRVFDALATALNKLSASFATPEVLAKLATAIDMVDKKAGDVKTNMDTIEARLKNNR